MVDIERIKERLDIVDVVGSYVELKRAGSAFKGLCPFHQEKTPSFTVTPSLQIYKCFGCSKGGDVLNFIQEMEHTDFRGTLEIAAEKAGIELESQSSFDKAKAEEKQELLRANELTTKLYHYLLTSHKIGKNAREYAQKRGLSSKEIQNFMVGYAPDSKVTLKKYLLKKGFQEKKLVEWGLLVERNGNTIDKFRNRLMQPVRDTKAGVVGFSGRYLGTFEKAPKYINSPETLVFKKNKLLYGLYESTDLLRKDRTLCVVEGNLDVISIVKTSIAAVAPLGTAFTPEQAKLAKRYADTVLLAFDADEAGQAAIVRSLPILEDAGVEHFVLNFADTPYKDPDEIIQADPKVWKQIVEKPIPTVEYLFDQIAQELDLGSAEGKMAFKRKIVPILQALQDPVKKNHYVNEASLLLEIAVEDVEQALQKKRRSTSRTQDEVIADVEAESEDVDDAYPLELYFLALLVQFGIPKDFEIEKETLQEFNQKIFEFIQNSQEKPEERDTSKLGGDARTLYKNLMIKDIGTVEDLESELNDLYSRIRRKYVQSQLLKLRKKLAINSGDTEVLAELHRLTKELQRL